MIQDTYICNSVVLAKYIAAYANNHNFSINMTKLQKLLYITYGVYLAVKGKRLTNEHPQAWPYGPVFPTTRTKLLKCCLDDIITFDDLTITEEIKSCVKLVFNSFGSYNASFLSAWSHKPNSPWDKTVNQDGFKWGNTISDEYILPYFKTLLVKK
jgi:uncharacterized phage-associated protein